MPGVVLLLTFFYLPIHYFIKSYGNQFTGVVVQVVFHVLLFNGKAFY